MHNVKYIVHNFFIFERAQSFILALFRVVIHILFTKYAVIHNINSVIVDNFNILLQKSQNSYPHFIRNLCIS